MIAEGASEPHSGENALGVVAQASNDAVGESGRELLRLAVPAFGANIVGLLDASVNAIWVGRYLGDAALAAVSNANTLLVFLYAGTLGVWMALSIRVGFYTGAARIQDAKRLIKATIWTLGGAGILVAIMLFVFKGPLLKLLAVPPEALPQAQRYLGVILLSVPMTYLYEVVIAALRGGGDTKSALQFSLLMVALDAGLNPVFIFGLDGLPRMGVAGSACATVIAQGVALAGLVFSVYWRRHALRLGRGELAFDREDWAAAGDLLKKGGPMGVEFLWDSILALAMITLVNRFGSDVTAAYGVAVQLWAYVTMPAAAIALAGTVTAAQSLGAKRGDRVRIITWFGIAYSAAATGLLLLLLEIFNRSIFGLFLPASSPALAISGQINRVASWSCVLFAGYGAVLITPRSAGAVWGPLALSIAAVGIQWPLATLLLRRWGPDGIWWSLPISSVIACIAAVMYYRAGTWRAAWNL